tara:strand:+ start:32877 stop:33089 length:213 start_codon:yes stop_codon:yes gene_type:complete
MASFQERLIETIMSDFENIKSLGPGKVQRNECNLLLKRIESAKKLFLDDQDSSARLEKIERSVSDLRLKS